MANNFTDQVYKKAQAVAVSQSFEGDWCSFMKTQCDLKGLLASDGLATRYAGGLNKLRKRLDKATKGKKGAASVGAAIVAAAKPGDPQDNWLERAATIKMLKHLYRWSKRGAQDVWIYSPPKEYAKWIYQQLAGSVTEVTRLLDKEEEVYSKADKKTMGDALKIALKCSQKTTNLLSKTDKKTLEVVKRWFGSSDSQLKTDAATLLAGFKKITSVCNANTLIFPDDPNDRKSLTKYAGLYGSVWPGGEGKFPVIYLAGAFKSAGNSGRLWLCAQTIIHEASHLEVRTKDERYDDAGLKPGTSFPHDKAIVNADSWGYFCIDLCGYLSEADRSRVLK